MLVEVPKWMFDAAECAEMRIEALARIDCETLRALMKTIIEQRASLKSAVIQPQTTGQAGYGDTDGSSKSEEAVDVVRRTTRRAALERSPPADKGRSGKPSGALADQHAGRQSSSRPAGAKRRTR